MAKRFTDTEKWKKPFLRNMKASYKLLWLYLLDECDHAGIWQVDFDVAQIKIGERLDEQKALQYFANKIAVIANGEKWLIPDFLDFQYGVLNPENRAHASVITQLQRYDLLDSDLKIKPLASPLQGTMDKDKDMVKDKEQAIGGEINVKIKRVIPTEQDVVDYFVKNGYKAEAGKKAFVYYEAGDWKDSTGKPVLAWKQKMQAVWFKPEHLAPVNSVAITDPLLQLAERLKNGEVLA